MKRITVASVNKELRLRGIQERLVHGEGYFYFSEGEAHTWPSTMVLVYSANDLTIEQWLEEYYALSNHD